MLALSRARAGSCGLRCIACPSVRRSVLTSSLAMAAALRFAVLICLLCSCAVQPALAPSLSQDRPTERAAREGCATTRDGRGCAAAEAAAHHPRAGRTGIYYFPLERGRSAGFSPCDSRYGGGRRGSPGMSAGMINNEGVNVDLYIPRK